MPASPCPSWQRSGCRMSTGGSHGSQPDPKITSTTKTLVCQQREDILIYSMPNVFKTYYFLCICITTTLRAEESPVDSTSTTIYCDCGEKTEDPRLTDLQAVFLHSPPERVHNLPADENTQVDEQHPSNDNQQLLVLYDLERKTKDISISKILQQPPFIMHEQERWL